jgi:hypothetical protein
MGAIISFEDHVGNYKNVTRPVEEEAEIAMQHLFPQLKEHGLTLRFDHRENLENC